MTTHSYAFPEPRRCIFRRYSRIITTGVYLPPRVLTNAEICRLYDLPVTDTVVQKTLGVVERHVADPGVVDSDLLVAAAQTCMGRAGLRTDQLSKILVTKFIGDRILPMTASAVQRKLGVETAIHSIDIEGGINAFLNALDLATRYISTTDANSPHILLLSGGLHNLAVSKTDPRLAFLFGDGAAAVLLAASDQPHFLASYSYTNPTYFDTAGSPRLKVDAEISNRLYERGDVSLLYDLYRMGNWKDTADFYVNAAQVTAGYLLAESGLTLMQIDLVLVTENNRRLRDLTLDALGIPQEKSLSVIAEVGNTMSAMLPILLDKALQSGRLRTGHTVMLLSHGEGASGGGMIYRV